MIKKTIILLVFIIFCHFTLLVCGEKNILANLTNSQEPEPVRARCFWLLGAGARAAWKKNQEPELEPEPLGKKIRSRSRFKKKSGAGATKKFAGSPALLFISFLGQEEEIINEVYKSRKYNLL